ncbi:MAG: Hsp20 family protein [Eubacteriaceae bacterium]|nr:Hsp20 family protein [Eubacteriaceae bacterium]
MSSLIPFGQRRMHPLANMIENMENMFSESPINRPHFRIDVEEAENEYIVSAEMPGISKEEISIAMSNGRLSITVNMSEEKESAEKNYVHRERIAQSYARTMYLPGTDQKSIGAKLADGMLTINVAKKVKDDDSAINVEIE